MRTAIGCAIRAASAVAVAGCALALGATPAAAATCANEAIRAEQHAKSLPGCRAYEMVSPVGAVPKLTSSNGTGQTAAAGSGGRIAWFSYYPVPRATTSGRVFVSTRNGATGWHTEGVSPRQSSSADPVFGCAPSMFFSPELTVGVLSDGILSDGLAQTEASKGYCGGPATPLVEGEPEGVQNLFRSSIPSGKYELVNQTPSTATPADAGLQGASTVAGAEFGHIVFSEQAQLTPEAPEGEDLYEWAGGAVHLVSVLPNGEPTAGRIVNSTNYTGKAKEGQPGTSIITHAVSADGSRVFFEVEGRLYVRINGEQPQSALGSEDECLEATKACTVAIDASGEGHFLTANAEGTLVFFTDTSSAELTADTEEGSGANLYEYKLLAGATAGTLVNLTANAKEAGVLGFSGFAEDGSRLYFVAEGVLPGAKTGAEAPQEKAPNLYEYDATAATPLTFIATLSKEDKGAWVDGAAQEAVASPNGSFLLFTSIAKLTSYDNEDPVTHEADRELYLYGAVEGAMHCVSCDPSGEPPAGGTTIAPWEQTGTGAAPSRQRRYVTDDGSVFFDTPNKLVGGDISGSEELYEYREGSISLLSSGSAPEGSYFYEASETGGEVFFVTTQSLLPRRDTDNALSLYDARVDGGFPEPSSAESPCENEECKGPLPESTAFSPPASVGFAGPGNVGRTTVVKPGKKNEKPSKLTRRQKLKRALKACDGPKSRRNRRRCRRRARRRYGAKKARRASARRGTHGRKSRRHGHHQHRHVHGHGGGLK